MSVTTRRHLALIAAGGAIAATLPTQADAYQGNMENALSSLYNALGSLRSATSNKGGHRVKAMALIQQAIEETNAGIEYAAETGGGGR